MKRKTKRTSERILIRGVNWIGDSVLTLPAIKAIRKRFPDAHISLLVKPWVSDIFKGNTDINEIILYNVGRLKLIRMLRQKGFDMAILLQNAFDAAFITWLSGIPERIGYKRDFRGQLLTKAIPVNKSMLKRHQVYYYLNLLNSIGIEGGDPQPYIHLLDEERQWAKELLDSSFIKGNESPIIGLNPGATYGPSKRWPAERFAELALRVINELNGKVVIFGGTSEIDIANEVVKKFETQNSKLKTNLLMMVGRTNLRELAALISECDVFITNDSGPMHMASALFVPTVAIFGSTDPSNTSPFGEGHRVITRNLPCSPCLERECPDGHLRCMTDITVDEVFSAIKDVLPVNSAIFLDRDGTLIEDRNYLNSFEELRILAGVKEELLKLKTQGFKLIGITNQSGIARGIVDEAFVRESNDYLKKELNIDDFYYCPHHPDDHCHCRKPEPMLLFKARLRHRIKLRLSYIIGDRESDMELTKKTGLKGILLSSNPSSQTIASCITRNIREAREWILNDLGIN